MKKITHNVIAVIRTDFKEKFGIPRQSGLISDLKAEIVFEKEFRDANALKGIEGFSHLWLLWDFSETHRDGWSPTVRPPRLGGNKRMGVFATRSPFRPNPIGLSCVKLEEIKTSPDKGTVLIVSGADLLDGTPILDIKPYLPFTDCVKTAAGGFAEEVFGDRLKVYIPEDLIPLIPKDKFNSLKAVLANDPRPSYQDDPKRIYGFSFAGLSIKFCVKDNIAQILEITED